MPAEFRSERARFLAGSATYLDDLRHPMLDGAAHAVFVRSTLAHARFEVDAGHAAQAPGVLAVVTAADNPIWPTIAYSPIHPRRFAQPLLAEDKVRYVGEPVAVVVAQSREAAIDAAESVVITYDELPVVGTVADAAADQALLFEAGDEVRRNRHSEPDDSRPTNIVRTHRDEAIESAVDLDSAIEAAEVVVDQVTVSPRQLAAPIECRGAAAAWLGDDLHVWMSTQTPHGFRSRIAPMYDLALSQIHVIAGPDVGGGFGGKGAPGPEEQIIPHLARVVGRPVRWVETRTENLTSAPHGRAETVRVRLAGSRAGDFTAISVDLLKDAGAYPSSGAGLPNSWSHPMTTATYDIAAAAFTQTTAVTNAAPVSALRGAGRAPTIGAIERAVDLYAAAISMDPVELRRRNLVRPEQMPYTAATGFVFDEADYPGALAEAVAAADYDGWRSRQSERQAAGVTHQIGIGVACYNHRTCGPGGEAALVRVNPDGSATVVTGTTSQGQDHETTWRTIASAELGIAAEAIEVIEGVTDLIATGVGAIGSRSVQTAGMAIVEASAEVVAQASRTAAAMLEAAEVDIVLDRGIGRFHVAGTPSRSLGWADVASELATRDEQLACDHLYDNEGRDVFPSGSHVAVVEVDTETGAWSVLRFVAVDDAGVRINPSSVEGQLHGGIALGIGQVLGECASYDDAGQPRAANLLDYGAVTADQLPSFELIEQAVASSFNPGGWKAVGESGPIGAVPAVHNAVLDAIRHLGVDHIDLPLTPDRVWRAVQGR